MKLFILFSLWLFLWVPHAGVYANAQPQKSSATSDSDSSKGKFDYNTSLKISQDAIGTRLGQYRFTDAKGRPLTMSDFAGKPLVLSMVFTSCYQICPMTIRHLSKVVEKAREALGKDSFAVAVVGFDTFVDTPKAMQYFANKQGVHDKDWHLLSISAEEVAALSRDLGFIYFPSVNGFDHLIQATIIDADSKVYQQVYGQAFDTPLLVEPLKELVFGYPKKDQTFLDGLSNKIKLFCTVYDPVNDGYYFDYSLFIGIFIGASIIIFTGVFMYRESRNNSRHTNT